MSTDRLRSSDPLVAAVLSAAAAPAEVPLPGEPAAVEAFRQFHRPSRRQRVVQSVLRAKVATAAIAGVVLAGGVATAATGTLPGVASITGHQHSRTHSTGPNSHAGTHPGTRGTAPLTGGAASPSPGPAGRTQGDTHGALVSDTATSPANRGVRKGAAVCDVASDAKCHAPTSASASPRSGQSSPPDHGSATGTHRTTSRQQPHLAPPASP